MRIRLDYGREGLDFDLPDDRLAGVLNLGELDATPDPVASVLAALASPIGAPPLAQIARGRRDAVIVVCDVTRPVPNAQILPAILDAIALPPERVTILIATGTHRPNDEEELFRMLGEEAMRRATVVNHHCERNEDMVALGVSPNGVPILLNRRYVEADLKITVGMIEPHFMAGYAGGRKMVMPGVAGLRSTQAWHSPRFLEHPLATNGSVAGNPVHEESLAIARLARPDFILDVALDRKKRIARVFAGDLEAAWNAGVEFVSGFARATVPEPVDVVVTSCGGHPLDLTYYQTVKAMVGAMPIVKPGGTIVVASRCEEGIGNRVFAEALDRVGDIRTWTDRVIAGEWEYVADQWQIEELAKAARHARIALVCDGIPREKQKDLFVDPFPTVEAALEDAFRRYGPAARVAVIPKGPYVIAALAQEAVG